MRPAATSMLATRLIAVLLVVLAGYGAFVAIAFSRQASEREAEALQLVSRGLAAHIVGHWPQITAANPEAAARAARAEVLDMLMAVNPGVQVYLLDADGAVADYLGEPGMVRVPRVDLLPVNRFLAGEPLPLRGTDPMGGSEQRLFSAAMFPPGAGASRPPGYLYIVLDGAARRSAMAASGRSAWPAGLAAAGLGLLAAAAVGALALHRLSRPLARLADRMQAYGPAASSSGTTPPAPGATGDEVDRIEQAFDQLTVRLHQHAERERDQAAAHRETMAGLAHDLRTPLTALHGHLEALAMPASGSEPGHSHVLQAAMDQSRKVRQLSQQLFELAALQAVDTTPLRERFRLDELVADSVGKFGCMAPDPALPPVQLDGRAPGALEVDGDLQLVERALTNLIDNARRHGGPGAPVTVGLAAAGGVAQVWVHDLGPGLPAELHQRLTIGQPLRDPPIARPGGGIGGLGLAIAQRVAVLHGGTLTPQHAPDGGTRLCLALPLAAVGDAG